MSQINCPHCGFLNFSISAYCGRCERPLGQGAESAATAERQKSPSKTRAPIDPRPPAERLGAKPRRAANPPPPQPLDDDSVPTVVAPAPRAPARLPTGDFDDFGGTGNDAADADLLDTDPTVVPVRPPSLLRLGTAMIVDALVLATAGMGMAACEIGLVAPWPGDKNAFADTLATWLALYPSSALRCAVLLVVVAIAYSAWGGSRGHTLGRQATGLRVLRKTGVTLRWPRALVRGLLACASALAFGAGYFWVVVDRRRRTWHDIVCGAVVISPRL